jgi:hypothetical protein
MRSASMIMALTLLPVAAMAQASYQPKNDEPNPYKPGRELRPAA